MSTHDVTANGVAPERAPSPLESIVAELEDLLSPLTAEKAQLEARLLDVELNAARIREGIAALTAAKKATPNPHTSEPRRRQRNSHDWVPSQKTLDDIYAVLAKAGKPLAVTAISDQVHTSRGTVTKGIEELRRQERVRFAGNGGKGNANLYAPMET